MIWSTTSARDSWPWWPRSWWRSRGRSGTHWRSQAAAGRVWPPWSGPWRCWDWPRCPCATHPIPGSTSRWPWSGWPIPRPTTRPRPCWPASNVWRRPGALKVRRSPVPTTRVRPPLRLLPHRPHRPPRRLLRRLRPATVARRPAARSPARRSVGQPDRPRRRHSRGPEAGRSDGPPLRCCSGRGPIAAAGRPRKTLGRRPPAVVASGSGERPAGTGRSGPGPDTTGSDPVRLRRPHLPRPAPIVPHAGPAGAGLG